MTSSSEGTPLLAEEKSWRPAEEKSNKFSSSLIARGKNFFAASNETGKSMKRVFQPKLEPNVNLALSVAAMASKVPMKILNYDMAILNTIILVIGIISRYICWNRESLMVEECVGINVLYYINYGLILLSVGCLISYYGYQTRAFVSGKIFKSNVAAFCGTVLWWKFLLEFTIQVLHPLPNAYQDQNAPYTNWMIMASFFRIYLWVRYAGDMSPIYDKRKYFKDMMNCVDNHGEIIPSHYEISYGTILKIYFYKHPVVILNMVLFGSTIFFALWFHLAERGYWIPDDGGPIVEGEDMYMYDVSLYDRSIFVDMDNVLWFTMVAETTVGYGDMVPYTLEGKLISSAAAIMGIVVMSLIVSVFSNLLHLDAFQRFFIRWKHNRTNEMLLRNTASILIKTWYKNQKSGGAHAAKLLVAKEEFMKAKAGMSETPGSKAFLEQLSDHSDTQNDKIIKMRMQMIALLAVVEKNSAQA